RHSLFQPNGSSIESSSHTPLYCVARAVKCAARWSELLSVRIRYRVRITIARTPARVGVRAIAPPERSQRRRDEESVPDRRGAGGLHPQLQGRDRAVELLDRHGLGQRRALRLQLLEHG